MENNNDLEMLKLKVEILKEENKSLLYYLCFYLGLFAVAIVFLIMIIR